MSVKVLIVGGGAVGTVAGYSLEKSGRAAVTFVLRSNFDEVSQNGYTIDSCDHGQISSWHPRGGIVREVPKKTPGGDSFDYVICCTKNIPDVPPSLVDIVRPAILPGHTVIVLLQNGLNIEWPFVAGFPGNLVLSGISMIGAEERAPGHILHNDPDRLLIGVFPGQEKAPIEKQQDAMSAFIDMYGAAARKDANVAASRWRKLLYNAVWNPISALTDLDTGRLRLCDSANEDEAGVRRPGILAGLVRPAMLEVCAAAQAVAGVELGEKDVQAMIDTDPVGALLLPSMQQDVRKGRFIECENILGEAVRAGEDVGVPMPILRTLCCLCKAVQFRTMEARGMVDVQVLLGKYSP